jgi:pimeloyl-ACP methyl ester carboxylesterase
VGTRSKCVLLLHDLWESRQEPNFVRLATALNDKGYAVLTFDFRGHGDSTRAGKTFFDFPLNRPLLANEIFRPVQDRAVTLNVRAFPKNYAVHLVDDVVAAKAFLDDKDRAGQVDAANLVVVGLGDGATVGALWLAAESSRHRLMGGAGMGPMGGAGMGPGKYETEPEVRHVAGAVWIQLNMTGRVTDQLPTTTKWLRAAGTMHVPMAFVYNLRDAGSRKVAEFAANATGQGPPVTQLLGVPDVGGAAAPQGQAFDMFGRPIRPGVNVPSPIAAHGFLAPKCSAETIVVQAVRQLFNRQDGASTLARPADGASVWRIGGQYLPARKNGNAVFQPVPVGSIGIPNVPRPPVEFDPGNR